MARFAFAPLGRLLSALVTLVLVVVIVFGIVDTLVDPAALALGQVAAPEELARLRAAWGLDRPWTTRLGELLLGLASFDLGFSRVQSQAVSGLIARAFAPTLAYALPGMVLATFAGIGGGLAAARRSGGIIDRSLTAAATLLISTSSLIIVIAGHQIFAHRLGLFPIIGWPLVGSSVGAAGLLILPVFLWALLQLGPDLRHYRALFVRELAEPYLDGLRSRGIRERAVLGHALRGASASILARLAGRLPHLVVGSLVIEQVFNIPGVGGLAIVALQSGDLALVEGLAVVLALITVVGQLLLEFAAAAIDPRLRQRGDR
ncbi:MAG TPA: ABC transporter permease [Nannocystis exedens]|nr:ABC transporter permease [Nannocystis exedens]